MLKARPAGKHRSGDKKDKGWRPPFHAREVAVFLLFAAFLAIGGIGFLAGAPSGAIAKGVRIGPVDVGGLSKEEARQRLTEVVDGFALTFIAPGSGTFSLPVEGEAAPATVDIDQAIELAYAYARGGKNLRTAVEQLRAVAVGVSLPIPYGIDGDALTRRLSEGFPSLVRPAKNADLRITVHDDGSHDLRIEPEREGTTFDAAQLDMAIAARMASLSADPITITVDADLPRVTSSDVTPLADAVGRVLARAPLTVTAGEETWTFSRTSVADWLTAEEAGDGTVSLVLDDTKLSAFLEARGASIRVAPKDAVFVEKDGRVTEFEPHADGRSLDVPGSAALLAAALFSSDAEEGVLTLPVVTVRPQVTIGDANPYGIRELIGIGESNFRGSPANRRKNIARGAELMNGVLIPPGEEFSLLAQLRPFDASGGYLPELVIKEDKTIPEYGGGLCQIGTTTFRGVLDAGLPVTMRQNHSYRVPYYERNGDGEYIGPGTDATIYDPAPDFRFRNDTGASILITTAIDGNKLTFSYWGRKDGRKAERSDVSVWGHTPPPPTKIVKTTELPPGEKKCTESPHAGSTASFTYTVTYPDGDVNEQKFTSVYRPWQEVCLLGVTEEELAAEQDAEGAEGPADGLPSADASGVTGT